MRSSRFKSAAQSNLRLDQALVQRALCATREKARRAILAGQVLHRGQPARKPSDVVKPEDDVALTVPERYVSRGGPRGGRLFLHLVEEDISRRRCIVAPFR